MRFGIARWALAGAGIVIAAFGASPAGAQTVPAGYTGDHAAVIESAKQVGFDN